MMSEDVNFATPQDSKTVNARNRKILYIDALIDEVRKRPFLWNKKHRDYGCRSKVNKSWHIIAATLRKRPDEVKAKWRNLKDSFHRLEKQIEFPPDEEETELSTYYTGPWIHFEKLLFLRNTRNGRICNEDYIEADVPEICIEDIKGELDISEHSNDSEARQTDEKGDPDKLYDEPAITLQSVLNEANMLPNYDQSTSHVGKRVLLDNDLEEIDSKRRIDLPGEEAIDEDLHFVKSVVPFLRRLNPLRKLIVRNEMQNLLIKEMLCERCRSFGMQANCRCCNLS